MRIEAVLAEMRSAALGRDFNEFDRLADSITLYVRGMAAETTIDIWEDYGMTPHESRILDCLARNMGKTVTRDGLMNAVYFDRSDEEPESKIIDIYLCKVRKKLQQANAPYWIETHWGRGYSLNKGQTPALPKFTGHNNRKRWHKVRVAA